ncbi:hypothetical protein CFP56_008907 [Quercus suber]|uniref:Uncharacterized protein n=1 Tax=Quercus suber TaxID=58331 RepID=A0AAW0L4P3_QUESU
MAHSLSLCTHKNSVIPTLHSQELSDSDVDKLSNNGYEEDFGKASSHPKLFKCAACIDNFPKRNLSYVQTAVQHHNELKQNFSYWRAAVRGLDIDPNRNFVHSQPADELARIEHIIRTRGESARSMTIGEIAEELKDFGFIWQILAAAEEGDVKMK